MLVRRRKTGSRSTRRRWAAALTAAGLLATSVASVTTASADPAPTSASTSVGPRNVPGIELPLSGFGQVLVADLAGGHVFVRGSGTADGSTSVLVTDLDGTDVTELPDARRVSDMLLSGDGTTVWMTLGDDHGLLAVDARTLTQTRIELGEGTCPRSVAEVAGSLWFIEACDGESGRLMSFGPDGAVLARARTYSEDAVLAGEPDGDLLYLQERGGLSHPVEQFRVARGAVAVAERITTRFTREPTPDEPVIGPDGTLLLGSEVWVQRPLRRIDSRPSPGRYASTVAVRADGAVAVGAESSHDQLDAPGYNNTAGDVFVFRQGATRVAARYSLGSPGELNIPAGGLAFGKRRLYAVSTSHQSFGGLTLHVVDTPLHDGTTPAGPPGPGTALPLLRWGSMAVAPRGGHVFYAGGEGDNGVTVTGLDGEAPRTLQHLPGPGRMALSPGGRHVFVPLSGAGAIARIDTRTLAVRRFPLGRDVEPLAVTFAGGQVWFAGEVPTTRSGQYLQPALGALSLRTGRVTVFDGIVNRPTRLLSDPAHPDRFTSVSGTDPTLQQFRVRTSGSRVRLELVRETELSDLDVEDVAITPNGLHYLLASPSATGTLVLSTRTLLPEAVIGSQDELLQVAVRGDGYLATAEVSSEGAGDYVDGAVHTWTGIRGPLLARTPFGVGGGLPGGAAFGTRHLYAVVETLEQSRVVVLRQPTPRPLSLDSDGYVYRPGQHIRLVAQVSPATARASERRVCLERVRAQRRTLIACRAVTSGGVLTATTTVRPGDRFVASLGHRRASAVSLRPLVRRGPRLPVVVAP